ncbi:MAG TPA: bifunctional riboflavin kinase/FAD synthetase [Candidatus Xenobia bacterium]|nr:bifunctional riboflavin kinase/FAD synthetase [Candidatus Xenobia bacterium]
MKVRRYPPAAGDLPSPVLTIGNFDGVHLGHQRILQAVVERARALDGTSIVMTFEPHPARVLAPERAPARLTTEEQKQALLQAAGVDVVLVVNFTPEFSQLSPRQFVEEMIHRCLGARVVCIGANFRFGHGQAGDARFLAGLGGEFGFEVQIVEPVVVGAEVCSSSLVRSRLREGNVRAAAALLGRPFVLTGKLHAGEGRGRQLGFPTMNFFPEQECLPAHGVYVTETQVGGESCPSVTNVGVRPTFDGGSLVVESHLLVELLPKPKGVEPRLEVRFLERLREERKFPSLRALQSQIAQDVERARQFFASKATSGRPLAKEGPAA